MKRSNTQSLAEIIDSFLKNNNGISRGLAEIRLIEAWNSEFKIIATKYTRNIYLRKGVLYLSISSSVLRNELLIGKSEIIEKLNMKAGALLIKDIVFL